MTRDVWLLTSLNKVQPPGRQHLVFLFFSCKYFPMQLLKVMWKGKVNFFLIFGGVKNKRFVTCGIVIERL